MKMEKEKKYFNRQYIPVIIGGIIILLLIAALVYIIVFNKDFTVNIGGTTTTKNAVFDHEEIDVDTSVTECKKEDLKKYIELTKALDVKYEVENVSLGEAYDEDGNKLGYEAFNKKIKISIKNVDKKLSFFINNNYDGTVNELFGRDAKDGVLEFYKVNSLYYMKLRVYVYVVDECAKTPLRIFEITPPSINVWNQSDYCQKGTSLYGTKYCEEIIYGKTYTNDEITKLITEDDLDYLDEIADEKVEEELEGKTKKINSKYIYIIAGIALAILVVLIFIIRKLKKGDKHEKVIL